MQISELAKRVNEMGATWHQYKQVNDRRLKDVENKKPEDPLDMQSLNKLEDSLTKQKDRLNKLEAAIARPEIANDNEKENSEYKQAFSQYIRKGVTSDTMATKSSLSAGSNEDGGYLVTNHMSKNIFSQLSEISPVRQLASTQMIATEAYEMIEEIGGAEANWTTETGARTTTKAPKIQKREIPVHEMYAQPKASQRLIDDSFINIENWLSDKLVESFSKMENHAFLHGNGRGKPLGLLCEEADGGFERVKSGIDGALNADSLMDLYFKLGAFYIPKAAFIMHRTTLQAIRMLKDNNGQYIWNPSLSQGVDDTILGAPVKECLHMPIAAKSAQTVIVGDFQSAYIVVDRGPIKVLRDPFTEKPYIKFYATRRVGGSVLDDNAAKILTLAK
jgi:HK97 family phage major capsid protein